MNFDQVRALLTEHFKGLLTKAKAEMAIAGRLSLFDRQVYENSALLAGQALSEGSTLTPGQADDEWMGRLIERYRLQVEPGTDSYERLRTETMRAHRDFNNAVLEHDRSLEHYDYSSSASTNVVTDHSTSRSTINVTLGAIAQQYESENKLGNQWASKTQMEKTKHIALLCEILDKKTDVQRILPSDAQRVKDALTNYPKNRQKNPLTRNMPLIKVLAMRDVEKLDVRTLNKYLQTYSSMFGWAKRNGYVEKNVFDGLRVRFNKKQSKSARSAFSQDEIRIMLRELLHNELGLVREDYQKWGPLIALYSGARLNEIAQIHLSDIREVEGIWCFDLNDDGETKKLKTDTSRRCVPIHSRLIDLGVLKHVQALRESGVQKLFQDFTYCQKNGWGRSLGRWFNDRFLVKLGIKDKGVSFHVFRHTVITGLYQAGVEEPIIQTIVGHERLGVTQKHYFNAGYKTSQLRDALEMLDFDTPGIAAGPVAGGAGSVTQPV